MRQKGKIQSWNDSKGFGFIEPIGGGKNVFLHISSFSNRTRRPEIGQMVTYALSADGQGRPCAVSATLPGDRLSGHKKVGTVKNSGAMFSVIVASTFLLIVALGVMSGKIPASIFLGYLSISLISFFLYAFDKAAAKDGAWRTSEGTLHLLSALGGWPGALIAQQVLRHKSKKASFRAAFRVTVIFNLLGFAWLNWVLNWWGGVN
ncbi:MAG: uncharacterized membrane protein YsdA (DUF1294 family)/cold shock CspA family protein [Halioglobus sp.]